LRHGVTNGKKLSKHTRSGHSPPIVSMSVEYSSVLANLAIQMQHTSYTSDIYVPHYLPLLLGQRWRCRRK